MKVGIIGTHWGRVHVGAFRAFGHEVSVLMGSTWPRPSGLPGRSGQNEGERSQHEDVWIRANVRSVGAFLDVVEGRATREQALAAGLCDGTRAAWIELGLASLLQ